MSYDKRKACPKCGAAIPASDIDGVYTTCRHCDSVWDVTDL